MRTASGDDNRLLTYVGKLIGWIPADAIGFYAASVTVLVDDPKDDPSWWLVALGGGVAAFLTLAGRKSKHGWRSMLSWKMLVHIVIVLVAFGIWSATVPDSGWQEIDWVDKHAGWTVVISAALGLVVATIAEWLRKWIDP